MKRFVLLLIGLLLTALAFVPREAFSQLDDTCPALITQALDRVEQICTGTGRNQVCYANSWTQAEPQEAITDFSFELGDIRDLNNIRRLQLSRMSTTSNQWGIVLMRLQANVPASLPGASVLFLLFGDVDMEDEDPTATTLTSNPMQSFRLQTGIGAPDCTQAPPSGLLVQTPHGVGRVLLSVNGVEVSLGSTVFFTAQANGFLTVSTLEGSALVHADGVWSAALPGTQVSVPMSANLEPAGPPSLPEPYTLTDMTTLPTAPLDRAVEVQAPLEGVALETLRNEIQDGYLPQIGSFSALSLDLTQSSFDYVTTALSSTTAVLDNTLALTTSTVTDTLDGVTSVASDTLALTGDLVSNTTTAVSGTVTTTVENAQALVTTILPEAVSQPVSAVLDTVNTGVSEVTTAVSDVTTTAVETVDTTLNTVTDTFSTVTTSVTETVTTTTETVSAVTEQTVDTLQNTVQEIIPLPLPPLPSLFGR